MVTIWYSQWGVMLKDGTAWVEMTRAEAQDMARELLRRLGPEGQEETLPLRSVIVVGAS